MRILQSGTPEFEQTFVKLLSRRADLIGEKSAEIDALLAEYRQDRELALIRWAREFNGVNLDEESLWIEDDLIKISHKLISADLRKAIEHAKERIERFQVELKTPPSFQSNQEAGISWGTEIRPLDRVGVYVPGGRANHFMTLLLCLVPAAISQVKEILIATPPKKSLKKPYVEPTILYLAKLFSIPRILVSGGVGALAALAFGTKTSEPVQKIVGSGSRRTAVAKLKLGGIVGIDGFSGPSETAFVCNKTTSMKAIAADIVSRADHDPEAEIFVFHPLPDPWRNWSTSLPKSSKASEIPMSEHLCRIV